MITKLAFLSKDKNDLTGNRVYRVRGIDGERIVEYDPFNDGISEKDIQMMVVKQW